MSQISIDVYSDPICPWCMIGKYRMDRALAEIREISPKSVPTIRWRVFQLNPAMAAHGMDRSAYLAAKFGGMEQAGDVYGTIAKEGLAEGIEFCFDQIKRTPNTLKSHALIRLAEGAGLASSMVERLFQAYFREGLDIGDPAVLSGLAREVGLTSEKVGATLNDEDVAAAVRAEDSEARGMSISGVPYFIIDGRYSLSGAVPPAAILRALELAGSAPTP